MHASSRRLAFFAAAVLAVLPAVVMAAASSSGPSANAWRCGLDGRTYSDTPCAGGREIEPLLPRPAADIAAAQRLAEREKLQAERMRREREQREVAAIAASSHPVSLGPVRGAARDSLTPRSTRAEIQKPRLKKAAQPQGAPGADEQTWRATAPASRRSPG